MFGAKLFAAAAMAIAGIGFVPLKLTDTMFDFYVHERYFVVAPRHLTLGLALLWGVFAGLYYFGDRTLGLRWNYGISLTHFLLWVVSFIVLILAARGLAHAIQAGHDPNQSWLLAAGLAIPVLSFIVGGLLFATNLTWAIVIKLKTA